MELIRLLVADDHTLFREGLIALLEAAAETARWDPAKLER